MAQRKTSDRNRHSITAAGGARTREASRGGSARTASGPDWRALMSAEGGDEAALRDFDHHADAATRSAAYANLAAHYAKALHVRDFDLRVSPDDQAFLRHHGAIGAMSGGRVLLDAGRYDPGTAQGKLLVAHEMVHVAQRQLGLLGVPGGMSAAAEHEAGSVAQGLVSGQLSQYSVTAPLAGDAVAWATTDTVTSSSASSESAGFDPRKVMEPFTSFVPGTDQYYSVDEVGLASALIAQVLPAYGVAGVKQVFDFLYDADRDDVAYAILTGPWADDAALQRAPAQLLADLSQAMVVGADQDELAQIGRIEQVLSVCSPDQSAQTSASEPAAPATTDAQSQAPATTATEKSSATSPAGPTVPTQTQDSPDVTGQIDTSLPPQAQQVDRWILEGCTDSGKLTDRLFVQEHVEYEGKTARSYKKGSEEQKAFIAAWESVRTTWVVPALERKAQRDEAMGNQYATISSTELQDASAQGGGSGTVHNSYKTHAESYAGGDISSTERGQRYGTLADDQKQTTLATVDQTTDQQALLARAGAYAAAPTGLTGVQQQLARLVIGDSQRQQGETQLDAELIRRLEVFLAFLATEGLLERTSVVGSGVRDSKSAHRMSMCYLMYRLHAGLKPSKSSFSWKEFSTNLIAKPVDDDGNTWCTTPLVADLQTALATGTADSKEQTAALTAFFKRDDVYAVAKANGQQTDQAIEGHEKGDAKRLPNTNWCSVSNHCGGFAIDIEIFYVFPNMYDPIIDALAKQFGLHRPVKNGTTPEYWHYERFPDRGD